jgi:hypothetical protein
LELLQNSKEENSGRKQINGLLVLDWSSSACKREAGGWWGDWNIGQDWWWVMMKQSSRATTPAWEGAIKKRREEKKRRRIRRGKAVKKNDPRSINKYSEASK